ncbi:hypothetical protein SUDANB58_04215 [Streptomyces sp. enrichment culture]|uniref:hypothetical protein n=1 Tax=Streptomyces sp. enrichment culture TaxID=1795815 RepID=UPI003F57B6B4
MRFGVPGPSGLRTADGAPLREAPAPRRDPAPPDLPGTHPRVARLTEPRPAAARDRSEADPTLGGGPELVPELCALPVLRSEPPAYGRRDVTAGKRILTGRFAGMGWEAPAVPKALEGTGGLRFDAIAQIRADRLAHGRAVLLGDAGYGATGIRPPAPPRPP